MAKIEESPRLDQWIKHCFPGLSNRQVSEAFELSLVTDLQGQSVSKAMRHSDPGSSIQVSKLETEIEKLRNGNPKLDIPIIYEDKNFWIVDKPAGMPSHPLRLLDFDTVTQWAFSQLPNLYREFREVQPTIAPHRLDIGTSGLLVVSKNKVADDQWRERFRQKQVRKKYLALAWGMPDRTFYVNKNPIAHHPKAKSRMVTIRQRFTPPVFEAQTEILVREVMQNPSRFNCEIHCSTGVTHQVRVHMADLGFPLAGDNLYDPDFETRELKFPFHQLRASEICWDDHKVIAP
jgi:23S rRNA pseudouridine1911/1915/1917 synthase